MNQNSRWQLQKQKYLKLNLHKDSWNIPTATKMIEMSRISNKLNFLNIKRNSNGGLKLITPLKFNSIHMRVYLLRQVWWYWRCSDDLTSCSGDNGPQNQRYGRERVSPMTRMQFLCINYDAITFIDQISTIRR